MRSIWTIARHTFSQCLRMKMAGLFIVLLLIALATMPFQMKGDGTLAGRIQTFLAYGTGITSVLLSLVTIFASVSTISSDLRGKQIFTVASKPLARWQYIVGRWLGVVLLVAMLLAVSATAIYGFAQYLRGRDDLLLNPQDRGAVETEVFAARRRVPPAGIEERLKRGVDASIDELRKRGVYENALKAYKETLGDRAKALAKMREDIGKSVKQSFQTAPPNGPLRWVFSDIAVAGRDIEGVGRVMSARPGANSMQIGGESRLLAHLIFRGPVQVAGVNGLVVRLGKDRFEVLFSMEGMKDGRITALKTGAAVDIRIAPTFQITYKASPTGKAPNNTLHSRWLATNQITGETHYEFGRADPIRIPVTLTVPSRVVDKNGQTLVTYWNLSPTRVTILADDIAVLYRVGSFEMNFIRAMVLILCQLAFLAGIGVLAGSFLSFPVGCLLCFGTLPFSLFREFLSEAMKLPTVPWVDPGLMKVVGHYILAAMKILLPDFARTSPGGSLVGGMDISWAQVGHTAIVAVAVRTVLLLALACLIFHKRELARVQV